jgi:DNA-binding XRE family transcriptional regulator
VSCLRTQQSKPAMNRLFGIGFADTSRGFKLNGAYLANRGAREEMTMRELRKARNITQAKLAKELNVKQEQISRIEKCSDLLISTLRRQVEALGGELKILASFPKGAPVKMAGFGELET